MMQAWARLSGQDKVVTCMYRKFAQRAYLNEVHQITISFNRG